jgi:hypothetical protein
MEICVVIPNSDYLKQAGARIRYQRITPFLEALGHHLRLETVADLDVKIPVHDVYLFSKCYDGIALAKAALLKNKNKVVGIDLFDDYFSQIESSSFTRFRSWLSDILGFCSFVLTSTIGMKRVVREYDAIIPVHVMNDAASQTAFYSLAGSLTEKLTKARTSKKLELGWFGIGDNPYFNVGLSDLDAFGGELAKLEGNGWRVYLTILTNKRALTVGRLAMLRRLPVPYTIAEWTEQREHELLDRSLACFLPVNAQNFSIVKSYNRAVTTLAGACQVLSAGYPLYSALHPFVYRDAGSLLSDLGEGTLKLRPETLEEFSSTMRKLASPHAEAERLAHYLSDVVERSRNREHRTPLPICVIHGATTQGELHKLAQRLSFLSVGSPFCGVRLNFDAFFRFDPDLRLSLYVADSWRAKLASQIQENLVPVGKIFDRSYWRVEMGERNGSTSVVAPRTSASVQVAFFETSLVEMRRQIETAFGPHVFIISDQGRIPNRTANAGKEQMKVSS